MRIIPSLTPWFPVPPAAWVLLWCMLPHSLATAQNQPESPRADLPNVLLILVDDLGFGDLACQGADDMQTPAIDALFADSLRLNRFYANCPVCSPTRASVLTGCYPDRVGVPGVIRTHPTNSWGYFSPHSPTLPQQLGRIGYHTAAIGKWHLGLRPENHPQSRGFDHFQGFLGDMMDDYFNHRRHGNNYMRKGRKTIDPPGHATELFSKWSVDFIRQRASQPDQPWFLYLAYNAPHTPIQPPPAWKAKVKQRQ
ncbi:MAG: sulfatase-like hydrolase/transferase, partial [Pirellulales bacterium]|nr:sulfatase-like hydrolase/transferase [Pirellulales bacterium]